MTESVEKYYRGKIKMALKKGHLNYRKLKNRIHLSRLQRRNTLIPGNGQDHYVDLRKKIDFLGEYIDSNYCYLDLPSHNNIGDHLISEGTRFFLSTQPYQKKYEASVQSFKESKVDHQDLILLQGGGNLGDLWPTSQNFREYIVKTFRRNKIIILPQTIFFQQEKNMKRAVSVFSRHPNLTICVRDWRSYQLAENNFTKNKILLLPDMASYIHCELRKKAHKNYKHILYMKREDIEFKNSVKLPFLNNYHTKDWPSFNLNYYKYIPNKQKESNFFMNEGILFLAQYDLVISTRLHGCILAVLLGIPTILLDNTYGKNKTYYETWLKDTPHCHFASTKEELERHFYKMVQ